MRAVADIAKHLCIYLVLCLGTLLMARNIVAYSSLDTTTGFLSLKQAYLPITHWKIAFYIHVFSSIFTLLAGFTQFSGSILKDHPHIHRMVGKVYVFNILFINFPAAMIMAIYANGFILSKTAFIVLDSLWFWFTLKAFLEIRKRNIQAHKDFMIRSFALTCSVLTLRTWKLILSNTLQLDPVTLYTADAWMGFLPNLLFAEWLIRSKRKRARPTVQNGNYIQTQHKL